MFRRLFYLLLLALFAAAGLFSAYLLNARFLAWKACADAYGRCLADTPDPVAAAAPMGLPLAYLAITFVLTLLALWALWGVLRPRRHRYA